MGPWAIGKGWVRLGTGVLIGVLLAGTAVVASASGTTSGQILACVQGAKTAGPRGQGAGALLRVVTSAAQCSKPGEALLAFPTEAAFVAALQQQAADVSSIAALQQAQKSDVTAVTAGTGLSGGGTATAPALSLAPAYQLPQGCTTGQVATYDATNGAWVCASLPGGAGQAQTFTAGGRYTFPAGVSAVNVEVVGAGGGGGGQMKLASRALVGAGGGGGGAVVVGTFAAADCPGGITVTVGQGGQGSPTGQFSGTASSAVCGTSTGITAGGGGGADITGPSAGGAGGTWSYQGSVTNVVSHAGFAGGAGSGTTAGSGGNNGLGVGGGGAGATGGIGGGGGGGDPSAGLSASSGGNGVVIVTPIG